MEKRQFISGSFQKKGDPYEAYEGKDADEIPESLPVQTFEHPVYIEKVTQQTPTFLEAANAYPTSYLITSFDTVNAFHVALDKKMGVILDFCEIFLSSTHQMNYKMS